LYEKHGDGLEATKIGAGKKKRFKRGKKVRIRGTRHAKRRENRTLGGNERDDFRGEKALKKNLPPRSETFRKEKKTAAIVRRTIRGKRLNRYWRVKPGRKKKKGGKRYKEKDELSGDTARGGRQKASAREKKGIGRGG